LLKILTYSTYCAKISDFTTKIEDFRLGVSIYKAKATPCPKAEKAFTSALVRILKEIFLEPHPKPRCIEDIISAQGSTEIKVSTDTLTIL
jgi:hypothetical protein